MDILENIDNELMEKFIATKDRPESKFFYKQVLNYCLETEKQLQKNVYEFSKEEICLAYKSFKCRTISLFLYEVKMVNEYIEFAIKETGVGVVHELTIEDIGECIFVPTLKHLLKEQKSVNEELIYSDFCSMIINYQDRLLFVLLFEGVKTATEIVNLKVSDIDLENNTIHIKTGKNPRVIEFSNKAKEIIEYAITEDIYILNNGMFLDDNIPTIPEVDLVQTEYLLKPINNKSTKLTESTFRNRFNKIKNLLEYYYLTPRDVWISGQDNS